MKVSDAFLSRQAKHRLAGRFTLASPFSDRRRVVQAYDHERGSQVALKQGSPEQLGREWTRLSTLSVRGILQPTLLLPAMGLMVFPWLKSDNFALRLRADDISLLEGLALLRQVGQAVCHCHRQGFIHGDIKPANIMPLLGGVLIDFTGASDIGMPVSQVIPCYLSPTFAAPGILRNQGVMRESFDWFSLAVALELLICRQHPFAGKSIIDMSEHAGRSGDHCFDWQACCKGHEITQAEFMGVLDYCYHAAEQRYAEIHPTEDGSLPSADVGREWSRARTA
ncbi:hypothetical protein GCM10023116_14440 [Kistimonas scapharcae]|uniref:Protein kinase domain-containing protein n=1 Tax=Kistimonas scapharcae TaxID=1036133 RepID=A0ABP8UZ95_9GAMM